MTTRQPRAYVQLEIPADCCGMKASVNLERQILFEFGEAPHENLLLFHTRDALQQFVDQAISILKAPGDTEQKNAATKPSHRPA